MFWTYLWLAVISYGGESFQCHVEGFEPGTLVKIRVMTAEGEFEPQAEAKIDEKGSANLSLPFHHSNLYQVQVGHMRASLPLDQPRQIHITRTGKQLKIVGSPETERLKQFYQLLEELNQTLFAEMKAKADAIIDSGDQEKIDELVARRDEALEVLWTSIDRAITEMGSSASAYAALGVLDFRKQRPIVEESLKRFVDKRPHANTTRALKSALDRLQALSVGAQAPEFNLPDIDGRSVSLADYRGKWVFLDFWASWCPNCRIEFPKLMQIQDRFGGDSFEILGVTANDRPEAWRKIIKRDGLDWTCVFDSSDQITLTYQARQLPTTFLIDPEGKIVGVNLDPEQLERELAERLPSM